MGGAGREAARDAAIGERLSIVERRAVAGLLRRAEQDRRDGAGLLDPGSARVLFGLAACRVIQAVQVSEGGMAALRQPPDASDVPAENPLRAGLLAVQALVEAAPDAPGADGRFAERAAVSPENAAVLRRVIEQALAGFEVTFKGGKPAGRATPLRPEPEPKPGPEPVVARAAKVRDGDGQAARPSPSQAPGTGGAMIAPAAGGAVGAAPFWSLMDRWGVGDLEALRLIGHAGGLTKTGTRPRFRPEGAEASRFRLLQQIDAALSSAALPAGEWLRAPVKAGPLHGRAPLEHITEAGEAGAREVHRVLLQAVLRRSME